MPEQRTADLVLEARTPYGQHWSCNELPGRVRELYDPDWLLSPGDVITVHEARTGRKLYLLRVSEREGFYAHLTRLSRR